jgi:hypothetical protein
MVSTKTHTLDEVIEMMKTSKYDNVCPVVATAPCAPAVLSDKLSVRLTQDGLVLYSRSDYAEFSIVDGQVVVTFCRADFFKKHAKEITRLLASPMSFVLGCRLIDDNGYEIRCLWEIDGGGSGFYVSNKVLWHEARKDILVKMARSNDIAGLERAASMKIVQVEDDYRRLWLNRNLGTNLDR